MLTIEVEDLDHRIANDGHIGRTSHSQAMTFALSRKAGKVFSMSTAPRTLLKPDVSPFADKEWAKDAAAVGCISQGNAHFMLIGAVGLERALARNGVEQGNNDNYSMGSKKCFRERNEWQFFVFF